MYSDALCPSQAGCCRIHEYFWLVCMKLICALDAGLLSSLNLYSPVLHLIRIKGLQYSTLKCETLSGAVNSPNSKLRLVLRLQTHFPSPGPPGECREAQRPRAAPMAVPQDRHTHAHPRVHTSVSLRMSLQVNTMTEGGSAQGDP